MKAQWCMVAALALALGVGCDDGDGGGSVDAAGGGGSDMGQGGEGGEGGQGGDGGDGGEGGEGGQGGAMPDGGLDPDLGDDLDAAPDPDMGPDRDAAPDPDMAPVVSPIECAEICTDLQTMCPEAFAIHGDCEDCAALSAAFAEGETGPLLTAGDVCADATESDDCRGLYSCLVDPDGLSAIGTGAQVTLVGNVGGVDYDIAVDDAWVAVGTANGGGPSDLELSFNTPDGRFMVIKFDNLPQDIGAVGAGLLDAGNNEIQVKLPGERFDLDNGLIDVVRFVMPTGDDPGFEITADVRENQAAPIVRVTARGTFDPADGPVNPEPEPDPEAPIDCPTVCGDLQTMCPGAFAIHGNCAGCGEMSAALELMETPSLLTAAEVCAEAADADDCRGLYTCLMDTDGLLAVGTGASATLRGNVGGVDYDIAVDDAWVGVGTTNEGTPSDLELSFFLPDGGFMSLKFDNVPADVGALGFGLLDAGNNEVRVEIPGQRTDLDTGLVEVVRFEMPGGEDPGFQITAEVRANLEAPVVTVTAEGTFR